MSMPHLPKISFPTAPTDPEELHDVVNVRDLEVVARRRLPNELYDYVRSGTGDEQTLRENEAAYQRVFLVPRILKGDLSSIDTRLTHPLVGSASLPVFVSPVGVHRLMHPDGELATMRACSRVGTLMGVSQHSTTALEEVAAAGPETPRWYQLYLLKDKQLTRSLVERAESAGYRGRYYA
jgi:isopentenyl diphosphate isomerase/L-lactate dehydrogenase-like FMN-dependent dehydrogenase